MRYLGFIPSEADGHSGTGGELPAGYRRPQTGDRKPNDDPDNLHAIPPSAPPW